MYKTRDNDGHSEARRQFLHAVAGGGLAAAAATQAAMAAAPGSAPPPGPMIPPGTLGAAGAGPGRLKIAMLVHPQMVMQDLIGPLTVFNFLQAEIHLIWKDRTPVMTEVGIPVTPSTAFVDCPKDLDVLFSPGGLAGTIAVMEDPVVVNFFADRGARAKYITADCTGSLLLAAAGLLRGYKATSHWSVRDHLALMGATPVHERVVTDRNRITGGGVTAGIDFGLTLAAVLRGQAAAESAQLIIEYAPAPPFNAGTPETAPKAILDRAVMMRARPVEEARQASIRAAAKFKS
jgi:cyclohexyl-isocyanide hydratase